jgi:hypothetical protein
MVNLLRVLRGDLRGLDLSGLLIRQADLEQVEAQDASLPGAELSAGRNVAAATSSTGRRPKLSTSRPLATAPIVAATTAELTTSSTPVVSRTNACRMNRTAPELTPAS